MRMLLAVLTILLALVIMVRPVHAASRAERQAQEMMIEDSYEAPRGQLFNEAAKGPTAVVAADKGQIPVLDTRTGAPKLDAAGNVVYEKGYRTLVIVEEY